MLNENLLTTLTRNLDDNPSLLPVFPLPCLNGRPPVLLLFDHAGLGIDVAYEKKPTPGGALVRAALRETTLYCVPQPTPVFAVSDGEVIDVRELRSGARIVIEHANGWFTTYDGLEYSFIELARERSVPVKAGDVLGNLGRSRAGPLKPLHFELWRTIRRQRFVQVDPIRHMRRWHRIDWNDKPDSCDRATRVA